MKWPKCVGSVQLSTTWQPAKHRQGQQGSDPGSHGAEGTGRTRIQNPSRSKQLNLSRFCKVKDGQCFSFLFHFVFLSVFFFRCFLQMFLFWNLGWPGRFVKQSRLKKSWKLRKLRSQPSPRRRRGKRRFEDAPKMLKYASETEWLRWHLSLFSTELEFALDRLDFLRVDFSGCASRASAPRDWSIVHCLYWI